MAYGRGIYTVVESLLGASPEFLRRGGEVGGFVYRQLHLHVRACDGYMLVALRRRSASASLSANTVEGCAPLTFAAVRRFAPLVSIASRGSRGMSADAALAMMTVINTVCVLKLRDEVPTFREKAPLRLEKSAPAERIKRKRARRAHTVAAAGTLI